MTGRAKIDAAVDYLLKRGVSWANAAPAHYRLAWALGLYLPPPHFQGPLGLFFFNALLVWVGLAPLILVAERNYPLSVFLTINLPLGAVLGLIMAGIYRFKAWRLGMPRWSDFPPESRATQDADEGW